jgi:hypothetical protein
MNNRTTIFILIPAISVVIIILSSTIFPYSSVAQKAPVLGSTNVNFTQLFKEKLPSPFANIEINVLYQSNKTVVLEGEKIPLGLEENTNIWRAVDLVKQQGYVIDSVLLTGQGSKGNPHDYIITLSHK